jgi:hypothetical protein
VNTQFPCGSQGCFDLWYKSGNNIRHHFVYWSDSPDYLMIEYGYGTRFHPSHNQGGTKHYTAGREINGDLCSSTTAVTPQDSSNCNNMEHRTCLCDAGPGGCPGLLGSFTCAEAQALMYMGPNTPDRRVVITRDTRTGAYVIERNRL